MKGMDALPDGLRISELEEKVAHLSKLLGKHYAMDWDELEAMLDRVAIDGWDMQRAKEWIKLWQNPREIENPYEAEIKALRAENAKLEEVSSLAHALAKAAGLAITEKENPLSLYNLDLRLTEFEQAGRDEATK